MLSSTSVSYTHLDVDKRQNRVWNYDYLGDERVIYSHIKNLRKKLGGDYIQTVRGVGYRVDKD